MDLAVKIKDSYNSSSLNNLISVSQIVNEIDNAIDEFTNTRQLNNEATKTKSTDRQLGKVSSRKHF